MDIAIKLILMSLTMLASSNQKQSYLLLITEQKNPQSKLPKLSFLIVIYSSFHCFWNDFLPGVHFQCLQQSSKCNGNAAAR